MTFDMKVVVLIWVVVFSLSVNAENYLMNAKVVSSNQCVYPNVDFKHLCATREFYEFAKIFALNSPQEAQKQYQHLIDNGNTPEARLWGYLGLRILGVISDNTALQTLKNSNDKVMYLRGCWLEENQSVVDVYKQLTTGVKVLPTRYPRYLYPKLPEKYFDVDLSKYISDISPEALRKHAKRILIEADMILTSHVSSGCIYTKEAWAFNYFRLVANTQTRIDDIKEIFQKAQFHEGKLYAYVLLKRLGHKQLAEELNAKAKLSEYKYCTQSGCIMTHENSYKNALWIAENLEHYVPPKRTDFFYNRTCDICRDKYIEQFDINAKPNRYDKSVEQAEFKPKKVPELELPLPRRFDINFDNKLSLSEAYLLAREFYIEFVSNPDKAKEIKNLYEKYLQFYDGKPTTIYSNTIYSNSGEYVAISKQDNSYKFDIVRNNNAQDNIGKCISFAIEDILRSFGDNHFYGAMNFCKERKFISVDTFWDMFANGIYVDDVKPCKVDKWVAVFNENYIVSLTPFFEENKTSAKYKKYVKQKFELFNKIDEATKAQFISYCLKNSLTPVWELFPDITTK